MATRSLRRIVRAGGPRPGEAWRRRGGARRPRTTDRSPAHALQGGGALELAPVTDADGVAPGGHVAVVGLVHEERASTVGGGHEDVVRRVVHEEVVARLAARPHDEAVV